MKHPGWIAARWAIASSILAACGGGGSSQTNSTPPPPSTFTIGGTVAGLGAGESLVLRNNGGNDLTVSASGAFTFSTSLANGAAYAVTVFTPPAGKVCSVNAGSGTVTNANVTSVRVACVAPLAITTSSLPNGVQGVNYAQPIAATGGIVPYGFALANGVLPPGLALGANGLAGVPGAGGTFDFNVQANDAAVPPQTALRNYTVLILEITSKTPANGAEGQPYNQPLTVMGQVGAVSWVLAPTSAPLPPGLFVPPGSPLIMGVPTLGGVYAFDVQATDSDSPARTHVQRLIIRILQVTTAALPNGTENQAYSQALSVTGQVGAVTWTPAPGSTPLPPGLALAANGTIAGTPTQTGTFPFAVQAIDSDVPARTDTRDLSITIDPAAPVASFEVVNVLEDGTAEPNIYLNNRLLPSAKQFSIGGDGRYVAFTTATATVLLRDTCKGGAPAGCIPSTTAVSNAPSSPTRVAFSPAISADARWVAYRSTSATEDPDNDSPNNGSAQFFVRDTCIGATGTCFPRSRLVPERIDDIPGVMRGVLNPGAIGPAISADGRYVLVSVISDQGLTPDLPNSGRPAVLVHDRDLDADGVFDEPGESRNHVVSYRPGGNTLFGDDPSNNDFPTDATLSGDGITIAMVAALPGQNNRVYVHDRSTSFTFDLLDLVPSHPSMESLSWPELALDGRTIAIISSGMLVEHVFRGVRAGASSSTDWITSAVTSGFSTGFQPPSLSSTGRFLAFSHFSDELGAGNRMGTFDVFVWDVCPSGAVPCGVPALRCLTGVFPNGQPTQAGSSSPRLSADGAYVVFISANVLDPNTPTPPGLERIYIAPTGVRE